MDLPGPRPGCSSAHRQIASASDVSETHVHLYLEGVVMSVRSREVTFDSETSASVTQLLETTVRRGDDWEIRKSELDPRIATLIESVLRAVAEGDEITVGRIPEIVTTTTAASMVGVSRPTLMKHIRSGRIPSHLVGSHRRLHRDDVVELRRSLQEERAQAIQRLLETEDELGEPL